MALDGGEWSPRELLYFQLKDEQTATGSAQQCAICESRYQLSCTHLSAEKCATLKAEKVVAAAKDEKGQDIVQVYECGHTCRNHYRVRSSNTQEKKYRKGMCTECLCEWVWERRMIRIGKVKGVTRPRQDKKPKKGATGKSTRNPRNLRKPRRPFGVYKRWIMRGLMLGRR